MQHAPAGGGGARAGMLCVAAACFLFALRGSTPAPEEPEGDAATAPPPTSRPPPVRRPPPTPAPELQPAQSPDRPIGLWYFYDEAHNHTAWMFRTSVEIVEPALPLHSIYLSRAEVKDAPGWSFMVKTRSILAVCARHPGRVVLYADTDIVFFRQFVDDIAGLMANGSDILFQGFPHPLTGKRRRKTINIGFMSMRCNSDVVRMWKGTYNRVADEAGRWLEGRCDQPELQHKSGLTAAWPRWDFLPPRYWISSLMHPRQGALHAKWAAVPKDPILCHPDSASGTVKVPYGKVPWKIHFIADQMCGRACSQERTDCYSARRPMNDAYQVYREGSVGEADLLFVHEEPRSSTGWCRWAAMVSARRFDRSLQAASIQAARFCQAVLHALETGPSDGTLVAVALPGAVLRDGAVSALQAAAAKAATHSLVAVGGSSKPVLAAVRRGPRAAEFWRRCPFPLAGGQTDVGELGLRDGVLVTSARRRAGWDAAAAADAGVCVVDDTEHWAGSGNVPSSYASKPDWAGFFTIAGLRCGAAVPDLKHDWDGTYLPADVLPRARRGPSPLSQSAGPPATSACKPPKKK